MKYHIIEIKIVLIAFLLSTGCTEKPTAGKSIKQLHNENGVPVRVLELTKQSLSQSYSYHAELSGIQESSVSSMLDDRVERVLFQVGDYVNKDDIVITFPANNPAAQYFQAKIGYEHAQATFDRMENLYNSGGIALQELENVRTQVKVAEANWNAVKQSIKVKAPISGIISQINVSQAENVHPGGALFTVTNTRKLKAHIWVTESRIKDMVVGNKAVAIWGEHTLNGKTVQADRSLNSIHKAFGVKLEFDNPKQHVLSGVQAEIRVTTQEEDQAIVIDRKDIQKSGDNYFAFIAANGKAKRCTIELGHNLDTDVEVSSGLNPGEMLITESQHILDDGMKIQIIK